MPGPRPPVLEVLLELRELDVVTWLRPWPRRPVLARRRRSILSASAWGPVSSGGASGPACSPSASSIAWSTSLVSLLSIGFSTLSSTMVWPFSSRTVPPSVTFSDGLAGFCGRSTPASGVGASGGSGGAWLVRLAELSRPRRRSAGPSPRWRRAPRDVSGFPAVPDAWRSRAARASPAAPAGTRRRCPSRSGSTHAAAVADRLGDVEWPRSSRRSPRPPRGSARSCCRRSRDRRGRPRWTGRAAW